ncbi:MAG: rhodanese-like domain-containing protein [Rhodospirillaceae bacterium]
MSGQFGGDVSPQQAWEKLADNPAAVLVDVRTPDEWSHVGIPDISSLGRPLVKLDWQKFPPPEREIRFSAELAASGITPEQPVFLICRSGVRSRAAGEVLARHGYLAFNVAEGFEGKAGGKGWKALGLPWTH